MNAYDDEKSCLAYLTQSRDTFWRLDPSQDVFVALDGRTLAFLPELRIVFERLGEAPPPPLAAVLMVLAATRSDRPFTDEDWRAICSRASSSESASAPLVAKWTKVRAGFEMLGQLPDSWKKSPEAKAEIIYFLVQRSNPKTPVAKASKLANYLEYSRLNSVRTRLELPIDPLEDPDSTRPGNLDASLRFLKQAFDSLDSATLQNLLRIGLEESPKAIEFDVPFHTRVRQFLATIARDEMLAGVSRLATELMAAVRLPQPLSRRQELPVGGVSDISNRGTIDRLLTSELAYDDLTLATRLAMNEALYLRRETPPQNPARHRHVLLDNGLRQWGVPRVLATSVALAISATTDHGASTDVYSHDGDHYEPVDLLHTEGLLHHLEYLGADLDLREAIPSFVADLSGQEGDLVLVTSADALADREFTVLLEASPVEHLYVISVDRSGDVALYSYSKAGRKKIRHSHVDLECLFEESGNARRHVAKDRHARLPAILFADNFPFLLPCHHDGSRTWTVRLDDGLDEGFQLSRDGRLLQLLGSKFGGRQITDRLAETSFVYASETTLDDEGQFRVIVGNKDRSRIVIVTVDLAGSKTHSKPIELPEPFRPVGISIHRRVVLVQTASNILAYDIRTAQRLAHAGLSPFVIAHQSRFLIHRMGDEMPECYAVAWNGTGIEFVKLPIKPSLIGNLVALFDRPGKEGPAALLKDTRIYDFEHGKCVDWAPPAEQPIAEEACVSFDGRFVAYSNSKTSGLFPRICGCG